MLLSSSPMDNNNKSTRRFGFLMFDNDAAISKSSMKQVHVSHILVAGTFFGNGVMLSQRMALSALASEMLTVRSNDRIVCELVFNIAKLLFFDLMNGRSTYLRSFMDKLIRINTWSSRWSTHISSWR
ncbi:uncharacterized protein LOC131432789 [Malaya genurostris]|uniref:uncharacterized protein LOC131432789 n=1 Tax=Malaya genurostris TaxID=325434 RepID=UPI0026F39159|nr:uncharacterized protein LOC131432789 [Malaya genurostris]